MDLQAVIACRISISAHSWRPKPISDHPRQLDVVNLNNFTYLYVATVTTTEAPGGSTDEVIDWAQKILESLTSSSMELDIGGELESIRSPDLVGITISFRTKQEVRQFDVNAAVSELVGSSLNISNSTIVEGIRLELVDDEPQLDVSGIEGLQRYQPDRYSSTASYMEESTTETALNTEAPSTANMITKDRDIGLKTNRASPAVTTVFISIAAIGALCVVPIYGGYHIWLASSRTSEMNKKDTVKAI